MKISYRFYLILLFSTFSFAQSYHYSEYQDIFDVIGKQNILKNKISNVEINIGDSERVIAFFNEKGDITQIEIVEKSINKLTTRIVYDWDSKFNPNLYYLGLKKKRAYEYMTKTNFKLENLKESKLIPNYVTQYIITKKGQFVQGETYKVHHPTSSNSKKSLVGITDFYYDDLILRTVVNRKMKSYIQHMSANILYPSEFPQEAKITIYEYDDLNRVGQIKNRRGEIDISTLIPNYKEDFISSITETVEGNEQKIIINNINGLVSSFSTLNDSLVSWKNSTIIYYSNNDFNENVKNQEVFKGSQEFILEQSKKKDYSTLITTPKFLDQIKIGEPFPKELILGGWKALKVDPNLMEGLFCKAFFINHLDNANAKAGRLALFEKEGGITMSKHYFFLNDESKVVGIRKLDWVVYAGSNGLRKFLLTKKRISGYIEDYVEWTFLDEFEYGNLDRYFAYTYKSKEDPNKELYVVVNGIKDNLYSEERYLPTSKYNSLYIVADPNEEKIKSLNQLTSKEGLKKICESTLGAGDKCDCFYEKAMKYIEKNKSKVIDDSVFTNELMNILFSCDQ